MRTYSWTQAGRVGSNMDETRGNKLKRSSVLKNKKLYLLCLGILESFVTFVLQDMGFRIRGHLSTLFFHMDAGRQREERLLGHEALCVEVLGSKEMMFWHSLGRIDIRRRVD